MLDHTFRDVSLNELDGYRAIPHGGLRLLAMVAAGTCCGVTGFLSVGSIAGTFAGIIAGLMIGSIPFMLICGGGLNQTRGWLRRYWDRNVRGNLAVIRLADPRAKFLEPAFGALEVALVPRGTLIATKALYVVLPTGGWWLQPKLYHRGRDLAPFWRIRRKPAWWPHTLHFIDHAGDHVTLTIGRALQRIHAWIERYECEHRPSPSFTWKDMLDHDAERIGWLKRESGITQRELEAAWERERARRDDEEQAPSCSETLH